MSKVNTFNETKMEPLLSFPHNAFLMLRAEYAQILQDDLQAKLLRIIEVHVETERKVVYRDKINSHKGTQPVEVPKDIFVPISYKLFRNDLFGLITSETTIKKALNQMIEYKIIFKKDAIKKRYASPEYSINTIALQLLLDALKNPGYQFLIPSILEALKNSYPQDLIPSWYQDLIPSIFESSSEEKSRVSEIDTNIRKDNITDKKDTVAVTKSEPDSFTLSPTLSLSSQVIPNVEKLSTVETVTSIEAPTPSELTLTEEENQAFELLCAAFYAVRPKVTATIKTHCATLAVLVHSLEEMQSLLDYTRNQEHLKGKTIYLANLVNPNNLNGWKQAQTPLPTKSVTEGPKVMTALEKIKANEEKYGSIPAPRVKPLEMFKQKQKEAALADRKA